MKVNLMSPHIDDAWLSAGGLINKILEKNHTISIDYVFTISDWTNQSAISGKKYEQDVTKISALRKSEELGIQAMLGYDYSFWDYYDFPLRNPKEEDTFLSIQIEKKFLNKFSAEDLIMFPIGINHPDHLLVSNLGWKLLKRGYNIAFFEDMPYFAFGGFYLDDLYATILKKELECQSVAIDYKRKVEILQFYESQISPVWIKDMMNYSYNMLDNKFYERFWIPKNNINLFNCFFQKI